MISVGERLRREREARDMTIDQVAEATGVGIVYLQAMESSAIDALPGRAFGKLYIRAYAEVLDFDPQPLIEDYDRELRLARGDPAAPSRPAPAGSRPVAEAIARWKASKTPALEGTEAAPPPEEPAVNPVNVEASPEPEVIVEAVAASRAEPTAPVARPRRGFAVPIGVALVTIATGVYVVLDRTTTPDMAPADSAERPQAALPPALSPPASIPAEAAKPAIPKLVSAPGALSVSESGLGRRIVKTRLEGESSQFAAGEVAWFQTRVLGGRAGETLRHVWIFDGKAQQSITLRLGGADWRTHSSKTLYRAGPWTVEARDGDGRVLVTASFTCVPAAR